MNSRSLIVKLKICMPLSDRGVQRLRFQSNLLLFVHWRYTWRAALEIEPVVFCSASTGQSWLLSASWMWNSIWCSGALGEVCNGPWSRLHLSQLFSSCRKMAGVCEWQVIGDLHDCASAVFTFPLLAVHVFVFLFCTWSKDCQTVYRANTSYGFAQCLLRLIITLALHPVV